MVFVEYFLRIFSKKGVLQKRKFFYPFQSRSYNNVVVTKQIYFSPRFLKSLVHISDNIAHVVAGSQYNYRWCRRRSFSLSNNYLDDVFTFKDLLAF